MGNKQRGKMKKRLLVAALAACMAFPASLPAQAAGTVHGKKVGWIKADYVNKKLDTGKRADVLL